MGSSKRAAGHGTASGTSRRGFLTSGAAGAATGLGAQQAAAPTLFV